MVVAIFTAAVLVAVLLSSTSTTGSMVVESRKLLTIMESMPTMMMQMYATEKEAQEAALAMGCEGAHKMGDEWMPGNTHSACSQQQQHNNHDHDHDHDDDMALMMPAPPPDAAAGDDNDDEEVELGRIDRKLLTIMESMPTMMMQMYATEKEAQEAALAMGCEGAHKMGDEWMPGNTHSACSQQQQHNNHDHDHDHDDDMALTMPAPPPDAVAGDDEEVELGRIDNYGVLIFG